MDKPDIAVVVAAKPSKADKKLTFPIPEGLDLEAKEEGETLEAVAEFRLEPNGKLCLKKVNGLDVKGYGDADDDEKPGPRNFAEAVTGDTGDY